MKQFFVK